MTKQIILSLFLGLLVAPFASTNAQTDGPLGNLFMAKEGGLAHYSSYDTTGGNADARPIAPGQTLVLMNHTGAGVVRRWWITVAPRNVVDIHRSLIIRCYWDGEKEPSVEVPVSDFFGMGFGEWKDFISMPLNMTSGGYNCYWPMPFHKSAIITVENRGEKPVDKFYYNIDVRTANKLPKDALYFHAQYKQERSIAGKPVTILNATGRGHYVGTLLSMQPERGTAIGYLEGDERIFIDGETNPSIIGTGTEDFFSSGWYYVTGEYSAPYHGVTIKDGKAARINTYRWHIEDPIPFKKSLRFDMEHGGMNNAPGVMYTSVAYWYQTHPHAPFPALSKNLLPMSPITQPSVDAEKFIDRVKVTGGELRVQDMKSSNGKWSNDAQLWWVNAKPGDQLTFPLDVSADGNYELVGFFTRARDYGIFKVLVNGKPTGGLVDGYSPRVEPSGAVSFGRMDLKKGVNNLVIELVGKDTRSGGFSNGYLVGIDGFLLYQ